ncbi:MAG TPA: tetratricopeptide repeat protein, partial [Sinorhizobium sp.]|nr:tetratricopeptide repeat protein [Sinorhizobium sp.]
MIVIAAVVTVLQNVTIRVAAICGFSFRPDLVRLVVALVMLLGLAGIASAQPAKAPSVSSSPVVEIEKALQSGDGARARHLIIEVLTPRFADAEPSKAAELVYHLTEIAGRDGDWSDVHGVMTPIADVLVRKLDGEALDGFIFNLSVAAGMVKKFDEQDRWLDRGVDITVNEAGVTSQRSLTMRANAAYSLLSAGRREQALARMLSTLSAMEAYGAAELFFNTAGQAGDAFYRRAAPDAAATIFERGLESKLVDTDRGPGKGFFWFNTAVFLRDIGNFDDAIRMHHRAMNYLYGYFGPDSREGHSAYEGLAQTLHAAGQLAGAEAAYRYVYQSALKSLGEDHPDVWRTANNLAGVLRSLKLPVEALEFDRFVYHKRYYAYGGGAPETVISAMNMAHDLLEAGRWQEAKETLAAISSIIAQPGYDPRYRAAVSRWQQYASYRLGEKSLSREELET